MGFSVQFVPRAPAPDQHVESDIPSEDLAEYFTLIIASTSLLGEIEGSEFRMFGFGRRWTMDLGYDMCTFLEAVPELVTNLEEQRDTEVYLYSQGIQCKLFFRPAEEDLVVIECISETSWVPDPSTETIPRRELLQMLHRLKQDVARGLAMIDSGLTALHPFDDWLRGDPTLN